MKIALVSPYDFAYPGGVTNHISSLKYHFTCLGQQVKVIAPLSRYIPGVGDWLIPIGKPVPIPANGSIARISLSFNQSSVIKTMLNQESFDIVHLHEPLMPALCISTLRVSNSVNIGTFHATYQGPRYIPGRPLDGYNFGRPFSIIYLRRLVRSLDGRIAVSRPALDFASGYFPGDYTIIPNGVELEHFHPDVAPIEDLRDGKVNILFVGRLEKRKGFQYLLEAYKQVKSNFDNCRLIVVGPGTRLRGKYERQVAEEGIKDVVFAGFVPYSELPRFYRTADVFCSPATKCESFGLVLLEAMAVGKPIIASDVEGYANVVAHGSEGLLVPPKDKDRLAEALFLLMEDEPLRQELGRNGRTKAQGYGWSSIARRVLDFYIKVLNSKGSRECSGLLSSAGKR